MYALMHVHIRLSKYRAAVVQPGFRELQVQDQQGDRRYGGCVQWRPQVLRCRAFMFLREHQDKEVGGIIVLTLLATIKFCINEALYTAPICMCL